MGHTLGLWLVREADTIDSKLNKFICTETGQAIAWAYFLEDAQLMAKAPCLLKEVERLRKENAALKEKVRPEVGESSEDSIFSLTPAQVEILKLLCKGNIYKEIADIRNITVKTVKNTICNAKRKTGSKTTIEMIARALQKGILDA